MTADQIFFGLGLTVVLAVGSQILASRVRIPALIVLLPVGFIAGALTDDINPNNLLGSLFQPIVSLAVALILFDSGVGLNLRKLEGGTRSVVVRLIAIGVPVTWAFAGLFAALLLGMSTGAALMLGAILVVSGPTVVGPLLNFVRPAERVQRTLLWEGSLIDPVGGILGALVFSAVVASGYQFGQFLLSVGVGLAGGIVGTALLWLVLRELDMGGVLGSLATVASVIGVAAGCDIARDDTGLLAALVMGLALANLPGFDIPARRPFGETVIQLLIGVLFISISASVTPSSVRSVLLPTLGLVAVLVLVTRPLVAWVSTLRSNLSKGERAFIGWMAPRGIVAAATASAFSKTLIARGIGGAADILPTTFLGAGLELARGELLAEATGRGAELEGVTTVLLLTSEDDFNALASTLLRGNSDGPIVYRVGAPRDSHGVVAPYAEDEVLFGETLTRTAISERHHEGAGIVTRPAGGAVPDGHDLLFAIRADGRLVPATEHERPAPEEGDTLVLLGPPHRSAPPS